MYLYIKRKSDGVILHACSSQTVDNPAHMVSANTFLSSRGLALADYEIGDSTYEGVAIMKRDAITPMEKWKEDMASFKLSREVEDLITEGSLTMNEYQKTIYDAKVKRRSEKP